MGEVVVRYLIPQPEPCSLFLEHWLNKRRICFLTSAIAVGILIILVNGMFSVLLTSLPWDTPTKTTAFTMGLCLSLQLIGIPCFLERMKEAFLDPKTPDGGPAKEFYLLFRNRLCDRTAFFATLFFVLFPFLIMDISGIFTLGSTPFFIAEHTFTGLIFDIINLAIGYLLLYFFAVILWMLIIVGWTLNDAQGASDRKKVPIDILAPDGVGGLGSVQALVRSLITYYFIIVTLLIISYLQPTQIWSYQALFVILLFIAGILFFYIGLSSIRNIARGRITEEIMVLNEKIRLRYNRLKENISGGDDTDAEKVKKEQSIMDVFYKERDRLMALYDRNQAFDIRTIAQSAASVIVPLLAFLVQLSSGADALTKIAGIF